MSWKSCTLCVRSTTCPCFMDGARLGYGLMAKGTDVTLQDIARLTDVFYIGGTKVGALCGEAVVFPHGAPAHFMTMVKQQGALLAKGRLMGLQFDVLFTDDLYTRISRNAIETADRLKEGLAAKGYRFYMESPTNQVFPILENSQLEALEPLAKFGFWEKYDDTHTVMRIATSWATRMEEIEQLIDADVILPKISAGVYAGYQLQFLSQCGIFWVYHIGFGARPACTAAAASCNSDQKEGILTWAFLISCSAARPSRKRLSNSSVRARPF